MMKKKTGVGIILLNSKKEVLLMLRDNIPSIPYPDCWDLPGDILKERKPRKNA